MMGVNVTDEFIKLKPETESEARTRFTLNYYSRGGKDAAWLAAHIEPLIRIAVPAPRPVKAKKRQHSNIKLKPLPLTEDADLEPVPWGKLPEYYLGDEYTLVRPGSDAEALV